MARNDLGAVVQTLRRTVLANGTAQHSDAELLEEFVADGDQAAFEALVRRHGPMVMGVCRRIVQHAHDAEDAFQATFLILARKAASLSRRELLSGWLYGVAYRVARRSRTMAARRHLRERPYVDHAGKDNGNGVWSDLEPVLDQELQRLPKAFQLPILLCDLQGKSRREAAKQMGVPEGTLSSRLARGRDLLRQRLTRRGVTLSAPALALLLAHEASANVPGALTTATAQAATGFAAGSAAGVASAKVIALAESGLKTLLLMKLQIAGAVLLMVGLFTGVTTWFKTPEAAAPVTHPKIEAVIVKPSAPTITGRQAPLAKKALEHDEAAQPEVEVGDDPDDEFDWDEPAERPVVVPPAKSDLERRGAEPVPSPRAAQTPPCHRVRPLVVRKKG